jgi:hypothetical protein
MEATTPEATSGRPAIDILSVFKGHASITIHDEDPEKRKELAGHVASMRKQGFAIFLEHGGTTYIVEGYDADQNDWLVRKQGKGNHKPQLFDRIATKTAKQPVAVANQAGG